MNKKIFLATLAGVSVALFVGACRVAQKGSRDTLDQGDATVVQGPTTSGRPQTLGGDPRVTLINAPCGNGPDVEVFIARARSLSLINRLAKLPAADWRVTYREKNLSVCAFMEGEKIEIAFFRIVPPAGQESCAPCSVEIQPNGANLGMPVLYASDPHGALLSKLASKSEPQTAPWFVVHRSGYGFFSNANGPARDAMEADFAALATLP